MHNNNIIAAVVSLMNLKRKMGTIDLYLDLMIQRTLKLPVTEKINKQV